MSTEVKLLIYTIVYNEAAYLPAMLESLLAQSDQDFTFLVSENHSTDATAEVLDRFHHRFPRIVRIKPDRHLSGIEHGHFAYSHVVEQCKHHTHIMFIGGHDVIHQETIKHLKERARATPESAILYTDTFRMGLDGSLLEQYTNSLNTGGVPRHMIPFVVLLGIGHNIMSSGIWRADVFQAAQPRFVCCVADHLLLCEAALTGSVTYAPGGALYLRDAPTYQPGWRYYVEKHIPEGQRRRGCVYDFTLQMCWLMRILERCIGISVAQIVHDPVYANYFLSAMQLYLIRYGEAAQGFDDQGALADSALYQAIQSNDLASVVREVGEHW